MIYLTIIINYDLRINNNRFIVNEIIINKKLLIKII